jgi:hypothetical protein
VTPVVVWSAESRLFAVRSVALGVYTPGAPALTSVTEIDRLVGRPLPVVHWYQSWGNTPAFNSAAAAALLRARRVPMITWEPWDWRPGANQMLYGLTRYSLWNIARGGQDAYITSWARAAKRLPGRLLLRFAHEMNGHWYPWGGGVGGSTPDDYVAAYRRVVDRFRAAGATNVRFVWAPNVEYPGSAPLAPLYPGDAYVDWVGMDGYNWGTSRADKSWQTFDQVFRSTYDKLVSLAPGKRFMISEFASAELGGDIDAAA